VNKVQFFGLEWKESEKRNGSFFFLGEGGISAKIPAHQELRARGAMMKNRANAFCYPGPVFETNYYPSKISCTT